MITSVLFEIVLFLIVVLIVKYNWSRTKLYTFAAKLSGPTALPLIGNGLLFRCKPDETYKVLLDVFKNYQHPMKLWMGPQLFAIFSDLRHVEKIMSSQKMSTKADFYKFMGEYGPSGIIHSSGPRWKEHRRMIQPLLNLKFANMNIDIIQTHINKLLCKMDKLVDGDFFDVQHILHPCCFDIIGDIVFGLNPKTQDGANTILVEYFKEYYINTFTQMVKPWLHFKPIFNMTQLKKDRDLMIMTIRNFAETAYNLNKQKSFSHKRTPAPVISQMFDILENQPHIMRYDEFIDNLLTLYGASEDTSTIITSAICLCMGMYPQYQDLAYSEIKTILGDRKKITGDDLSRMKYLQMCIKDAMRLFPIGPFLVRKTVEEFDIDDYVIPPGCQVLIPVHDIHRDPKYWDNPMHFHPDHFLPEAIKKRHNYAYMPFSSGPRSCIGLHLAMQVLKVMMANILLTYRIEANGQIPDVDFTTDISLRVKGGYKIKLFKRNVS